MEFSGKQPELSDSERSELILKAQPGGAQAVVLYSPLRASNGRDTLNVVATKHRASFVATCDLRFGMRELIPGVGRFVKSQVSPRRRGSTNFFHPFVQNLQPNLFPGSYNLSLLWFLKSGQARLYTTDYGADGDAFQWAVVFLTKSYGDGGAGAYGGYFYNASIRPNVSYVTII